jgi:hypothetical protein
MGKRLTYDEVYNYFKSQGCELLEDRYINNNTKMKYKCSCGNVSYIKFGNFKLGQRCMECSGNKKYTYEQIKEIVESHGFKLLSKEYKNANEKLKIKCKNGHEHEMSLSVIKRGDDCPYCSGNIKFTYDQVVKVFKDNNCVLLEKEYINTRTNMRFICTCGNVHSTTFTDFRNGRRCRECGYKKVSEKLSLDFEFVKNFFENEGYILLSDNYINNSQSLDVVCPNGHEYSTTFQGFKNGNRCRICSGFNIYTLEDVKDYFKNEGCILLEDNYVNMHTKMKYICSCGKENTIDFTHFIRGQRCSKCGINKLSESLRLDFEYVKEFIENNNYRLLDNNYTNAHEKLYLKCPENHDYFVSFDSFKSGKRCSICSGLYKYNIENVTKLFLDASCILLETDYINSNIPMRYICSCGTESKISLNSFLRGSRCQLCGNKKSAKKHKLDFEIIINMFKNRGCILLSKQNDYKDKETKLKYICKCGAYHETSFASFKYSETGCFNCRNKLIGDKNRKYSIEILRPIFEERGFVLTSTEYIDYKIPLEFICDKGHNAKTHLYHFLNGAGCKQCYNESVRGEKSPHWNPNKTDEERIYGRSYHEYNEWRIAIFERDNYTCQCCGLGQNLNAHHLNSYHWAIDERTNENNGITLCENCHDDFHLCYGNRDNTREQFEEYMEGISWNIKELYDNSVV